MGAGAQPLPRRATPLPERLRDGARRVLGAGVLASWLFTPWLRHGGDPETGWYCLGWCVQKAWDSGAATLVHDLGDPDPAKQLAAARAGLCREAAAVHALVALAAAVLLLVPPRWAPRVSRAAALVGALATTSLLLVWMLPARPFELGDLGAAFVVALVLAPPLGVLGLTASASLRAWILGKLVEPAVVAAVSLAFLLRFGPGPGPRAAALAFAVALLLGRWRRAPGEGVPPRASVARQLGRVAVGLVPLAFLVASGELLRPWRDAFAVRELLAHEGHDLRKLVKADHDRVEELAAPFLSEREEHLRDEITLRPSGAQEDVARALFGWGDQLWYAWSVEVGGEPACVLFEGHPLLIIPGESGARVVVLALDGHRRFAARFSTGWRIDIRGARLLAPGEHGFPAFAVDTAAAINGRTVPREIYALTRDHVALVRLEDSSGAATRNNYMYPNHTIGPEPPARTVEGWERVFAGSDPALLLEALTWHAGIHRSPGKRERDVQSEEDTDAELAARVRQSPLVRRRVEELTHDPDAWISEAARLALDPSPR